MLYPRLHASCPEGTMQLKHGHNLGVKHKKAVNESTVIHEVTQSVCRAGAPNAQAMDQYPPVAC